jgi:hypothetical protein
MNKNGLRILFIAAVAFVFVISFLPSSSAQNRDRFSHATAAHKRKDCASCHNMPTGNWVSARGFPDVADFPGHAACASCHMRDFFRGGNKPALCLGCHTDVGPGRGPRFAFPVRTRSHEFLTKFPHNVHQDVVASNQQREPVAVAHFVNASFTTLPDDKPEQFNNCAICHETSTKLPKFETFPPKDRDLAPLGLTLTENFAPTPAFFKDMPSGHASCFACHYTGVKPTANNCAGCHTLTKSYSDTNILGRYSLKFDHMDKNERGDLVHTKDCMTCHVRISQNDDVAKLKDPDVPVLACIACHGDKLTEEIGKRESSLAANSAAFQCTYCHTTAIGRFPVPVSHK